MGHYLGCNRSQARIAGRRSIGDAASRRLPRWRSPSGCSPKRDETPAANVRSDAHSTRAGFDTELTAVLSRTYAVGLIWFFRGRAWPSSSTVVSGTVALSTVAQPRRTPPGGLRRSLGRRRVMLKPPCYSGSVDSSSSGYGNTKIPLLLLIGSSRSCACAKSRRRERGHHFRAVARNTSQRSWVRLRSQGSSERRMRLGDAVPTVLAWAPKEG